MKLTHLPMILTVASVLAASANAADSTATKSMHHKAHKAHKHHEKEMHHEEMKAPEVMSKDFNFVTLKGGLVNPTPLGGNSGLNVGNDTYTLGLAVGRKFEDKFAVEFEYMFRGKNASKAYNTSATPSDNNTEWKTSSNTFMVNAAADLLDCEKFRPFVKAGIGISVNKAYDYVFTNTEENNGTTSTNTSVYKGKTTNSFAWQMGFGANMKTSEMFDTQLQYMYVDRGAVKTHDNFVGATGSVNSDARKGWMKEHVITIGLVTKF